MKRIGLVLHGLGRWRLGCAGLYVEQEVEPRAREGRRRVLPS
jgi:hypothetical protein